MHLVEILAKARGWKRVPLDPRYSGQRWLGGELTGYQVVWSYSGAQLEASDYEPTAWAVGEDWEFLLETFPRRYNWGDRCENSLRVPKEYEARLIQVLNTRAGEDHVRVGEGWDGMPIHMLEKQHRALRAAAPLRGQNLAGRWVHVVNKEHFSLDRFQKIKGEVCVSSFEEGKLYTRNKPEWFGVVLTGTCSWVFERDCWSEMMLGGKRVASDTQEGEDRVEGWLVPATSMVDGLVTNSVKMARKLRHQHPHVMLVQAEMPKGCPPGLRPKVTRVPEMGWLIELDAHWAHQDMYLDWLAGEDSE